MELSGDISVIIGRYKVNYLFFQLKLGSDESFYNLKIYEVFTDLSVAIKRDLQRYCHP